MILDDETNVIDLYFSITGWVTEEDNYTDFQEVFDFNDPFPKMILELARKKWPIYDEDDGSKETAQMLRENNIGEVV